MAIVWPPKFIKPWPDSTEVLHLMAQQPHLTAPNSYDSTLKASYHGIKTQVESYFFRHLCRIIGALSNAKAFLMEVLSIKPPTTNKSTRNYIMKMSSRRRGRKKLLKSITMWCSWPSSHVIPMPESAASHSYWNSVISDDVADDGTESGYLQWLEEKDLGGGDNDAGEIDRLAEKFIESCHEKFRLEKQESYRRYHEMLARSI